MSDSLQWLLDFNQQYEPLRNNPNKNSKQAGGEQSGSDGGSTTNSPSPISGGNSSWPNRLVSIDRPQNAELNSIMVNKLYEIVFHMLTLLISNIMLACIAATDFSAARG